MKINDNSIINEMIKTVCKNKMIKKETLKLLQVKTDFSRQKKKENIGSSNESISFQITPNFHQS